MRILPFYLLGLLLAPAAHAETYLQTGSELLALCGAGDETSIGLCLGYVSGAIDMQTLQDQSVGECLAFYMPQDVTRAAVSKAVVDYLQKHPDAQKAPASYAVYQAISAAYPCPK